MVIVLLKNMFERLLDLQVKDFSWNKNTQPVRGVCHFLYWRNGHTPKETLEQTRAKRPEAGVSLLLHQTRQNRAIPKHYSLTHYTTRLFKQALEHNFNIAFENTNILVTVSVFALNINRHSALKISHSILARNLGYKKFYLRRLMSECLKSMGEEDAGKQIKYRVTKRTGLQTEFRKMSGDSITHAAYVTL